MYATKVTAPTMTAAPFATGSGEKLYINPSYKPGFQVGMGFAMKGMDDWNLYAEYTWYKNTASNSSSAGSGDVIVMSANPVGGRVVLAENASATSTFKYN